MSGTRAVTLTVRFLCELGMLAAFAIWGALTGEGIGAVSLAVLAPVAVAAVWWAFVAPKARWPVPLGVRVAIEVVLFGAAALALWSVDLGVAAFALAVPALATSVANALQERAEPSAGARRGAR
jgi:hypothetical protein